MKTQTCRIIMTKHYKNSPEKTRHCLTKDGGEQHDESVSDNSLLL